MSATHATIATIARLSVAPVKGLRLSHPEEIGIDRVGVAGNRRFYLVHPDGRRLRAEQRAPLTRVRADYDEDRDRLTLTFPDGRVVEGAVELGEPTTTELSGQQVAGRLVEGPWSEALGDELGREVRLVRAEEEGVTAHPLRTVSLVSRASVDHLADASGAPEPIDVRRFRMLVELDGCAAHEEDSWVGRRVQVGTAIVRVVEPLERCVFTEHDPITGEHDFPTLKAIRTARGLSERRTLDLGVAGEVVEPGRAGVGDRVEPL